MSQNVKGNMTNVKTFFARLFRFHNASAHKDLCIEAHMSNLGHRNDTNN